MGTKRKQNQQERIPVDRRVMEFVARLIIKKDPECRGEKLRYALEETYVDFLTFMADNLPEKVDEKDRDKVEEVFQTGDPRVIREFFLYRVSKEDLKELMDLYVRKYLNE